MSVTTIPRARNKKQIMDWANRQKSAPLSAAQASAMDSVYPEWRNTLNGAWFTKLEAVEAFVATNGFLPRSAAKDLKEKPLGVWLAAQRQRAGQLSGDRIKLLDSRIPGWNNGGHEAKWRRNIDALEAFVAAHSRMPSERDNDSESRRLAIWVGTHRRGRASLSADRRDELNRRIPGWDRTADSKWNECLGLAIAYIAEHGHFPVSNSSDADTATSARWIRTQRAMIDSMPAHRASALDKGLPGWRERLDDRWEVMLDYVARFKDMHGSFPSGTSQDPEESRAGGWMVRQRQGAGLTQEREKVLDERVPGWRETAKTAWFRKLAEYKEFCDKNARRPLTTAADDVERRLAGWFSSTKGSDLPEDRAAALAAAGLGDLRRPDQIWKDTLRLVTAFHSAHGRFPARSGKDPDERALGAWLAYQRNARARMSLERTEVMDARLPGWNLTLEDLWRIRFQACVDFLQTNGRLPCSGEGASEVESESATWIQDQRRNRRRVRTERIAMLDEKLPGWRGSAPQVEAAR